MLIQWLSMGRFIMITWITDPQMGFFGLLQKKKQKKVFENLTTKKEEKKVYADQQKPTLGLSNWGYFQR